MSVKFKIKANLELFQAVVIVLPWLRLELVLSGHVQAQRVDCCGPMCTSIDWALYGGLQQGIILPSYR